METKQAVEKDEDGDRISQLPRGLLHHILSFLSQKEAIRTSVYSNSWRYLGCTRPKIEFCERFFRGNRETFRSILDKTLRKYHDQNLCVQEFCVEMLEVDPESILFLEKWIPIVMIGAVKTFDLSFFSPKSAYFDLPSEVFKSKSLQKLCLKSCKLNQNSIDKVLFNHLQTLSLTQVYIADETFQKIMSSCLFIEYVVLHRCLGLTTIKVNKAHNNNLKHFDFLDIVRKKPDEIYLGFEINDVPSLKTITIRCAWNWYHYHNNNMYFPRLKSLYLFKVRLSTRSFDILSSNFPCLQDLSIHYCCGFKEFQLLNRSIEHLAITCSDKSNFKATIDAPNIVKFVYGGNIPQTISFTTTSIEWKSNIDRCYSVDLIDDDDHDSSSWFLELNKLLKAVSQSEISLKISHQSRRTRNIIQEDIPVAAPADINNIYGGVYEPVLVEHLHLSFSGHSYSSFLPVFLSRLFCICHPRNIRQYWFADPQDALQCGGNQLTQFLCKILLMERQDLEQVRMEVFDGEKWHSVEGISFLESAAALLLTKNQYIQVCFKLKWRK